MGHSTQLNAIEAKLDRHHLVLALSKASVLAADEVEYRNHQVHSSRAVDLPRQCSGASCCEPSPQEKFLKSNGISMTEPFDKLSYELQVSGLRDAVWVHSSDGGTVGRFGRMGIDIHNSITDQISGQPECRLCTHGRPSLKDWLMFVEKAKEFWGVDVPVDSFNPLFLKG